MGNMARSKIMYELFQGGTACIIFIRSRGSIPGSVAKCGCLHLKETTTAKRSATIDRAYPSQARFAFGIWPESLCLGENLLDVRIWSPYFYHIPTLLSCDQAELLVNADPTDHPSTVRGWRAGSGLYAGRAV
jgi:hypothetical protein